eukprot:scaffold1181_cov112-Isochrysis_galbana.AAC.2
MARSCVVRASCASASARSANRLRGGDDALKISSSEATAQSAGPDCCRSRVAQVWHARRASCG